MGRYRSRSRSPGRHRSRSTSPRRSRSPKRRPHRDHHGSHGESLGRDHHRERRRRSRSHSHSRSPRRERGGRGHGYGSRSPVDDRRREHRIRGSDTRSNDRLPPPPPPHGLRHEGPPGAPQSDIPPPVGTILQGEVQSVRPFGMFVRMKGYSRDGLVHSSQVSSEIEIARDDEDDMKVKAMEFVARKGEAVWVKVVEAREEQPGRWRVGCSMKAVNQADGTDLDPSGLMGPGGSGARAGGQEGAPEVGTVHQAAVRNIKPYGVFVQLDGWRRYGLVTVHQISDYMGIGRDDSDEEKIAALQGVVSVDERIWVKVVEVTEDDRGLRIGCSMKLVSQADGRDLDPNNLQYKPRGEGGGPGGRAPVGQSAGQVTGSKIDWGHLAAGEYQHGDQSKNYEILDDDDDEPRPAAAGPRHPPGPPSPNPGHGRAPPPPAGRGRGLTMPAWMTNPESRAPGAPVDAGPPRGGAAGINSVEEALAILERFKKKSSKDKKSKDSKHKKHKSKDSKHKSHKSKKSKSSSKRRASASEDSSGSA